MLRTSMVPRSKESGESPMTSMERRTESTNRARSWALPTLQVDAGMRSSGRRSHCEVPNEPIVSAIRWPIRRATGCRIQRWRMHGNAARRARFPNGSSKRDWNDHAFGTIDRIHKARRIGRQRHLVCAGIGRTAHHAHRQHCYHLAKEILGDANHGARRRCVRRHPARRIYWCGYLRYRLFGLLVQRCSVQCLPTRLPSSLLRRMPCFTRLE